MAAAVFQACDRVRIVPDAAKALAKDEAFTNTARTHFKSLKDMHVSGGDLSTSLVHALACSESLEALVLQHCIFDDPPPAILMHPPRALRHFSLRGSVIRKPPPPPYSPPATTTTHTHFHPCFFADLHAHCPHLHTLHLPSLRYYNLLDCPATHVAPSLFRRLGEEPPPTHRPPPPVPPTDTPIPPNVPATQDDSPDFEPVEAFQQWLRLLPDGRIPQAYTDRPFQLPATIACASPTLTSLTLSLAQYPERIRIYHFYRDTAISQFPSLRVLTIAFHGANLTALNTNLPALSGCTMLRTLRLHRVVCDLRTFRRFTRDTLPALPHLRDLEVRNFCVPASTAENFIGPHREVLAAAAALTHLRSLRICQDSPRCNFDMMPACVAPVATLTALTFLELAPMRWLPPDAALAAAGGADGAVPADVPGHMLQIVEWAAGGEDGAADALSAEINLGGLKAVLADCRELRELHLPSLVPVALQESALRVFEVLPRLEYVNMARVTIPRSIFVHLCRTSPALLWRSLWRLHTGTPYSHSPAPSGADQPPRGSGFAHGAAAPPHPDPVHAAEQPIAGRGAGGGGDGSVVRAEAGPLSGGAAADSAAAPADAAAGLTAEVEMGMGLHSTAAEAGASVGGQADVDSGTGRRSEIEGSGRGGGVENTLGEEAAPGEEAAEEAVDTSRTSGSGSLPDLVDVDAVGEVGGDGAVGASAAAVQAEAAKKLPARIELIRL
eukprot:jgi/Ulvmu1/2789/UM140_0019.1